MMGSIEKPEEGMEEEAKTQAWVPTKLNWTVFHTSSRSFSTMRTYLSMLSYIASGIATSPSKAKSNPHLIQTSRERFGQNEIQ
jgi:hypothetical protein